MHFSLVRVFYVYIYSELYITTISKQYGHFSTASSVTVVQYAYVSQTSYPISTERNTPF